jgi:hypothetical protein
MAHDAVEGELGVRRPCLAVEEHEVLELYVAAVVGFEGGKLGEDDPRRPRLGATMPD